MNILIFVMTMLMMLSILTYAKFASFRASSIVQYQFEQFIQKSERRYVSEKAKALYTNIHLKRRDQKERNIIRGGRALSIGILLDAENLNKEPVKYQRTMDMLIELANGLYSKYDFYRVMKSEKRPMFLQEIVKDIQEKVAFQPDGQKISVGTPVSALANIELSDEELHDVYYKMLRTVHSVDEKVPECPSLLDYISLDNKPISVYLAPKEVLEVIFADSDAVEGAMARREQIYKKLTSDDKNESISPANAMKDFQNDFAGKLKVPIDMVTFEVSKTNPKR